ncbi:hypothetical protein LINGRAHAP2_LOCUS11302 [Linum grandiflorum]
MMYEKEDHNDDYGDDAFYLEIRRQILLLTADQHEDDGDRRRKGTPCCCRGRVMAEVGPYSAGQIGDCTDVPPPDWLVNLWTSSTTSGSGNVVGTGVFIPRITVKSRPRKNNRYRRKIK